MVNMNQLMAQMGGQVMQLEAKVNIIDEQTVQQAAMKARTNELDFAKEMKTFTSMQVILQSSNAMIAQANMKTQLVLQLFGG
jgi:flagellin